MTTNVWEVMFTHNYYDEHDKRIYEKSMRILFESPSERQAILDGIRWAINRREAMKMLGERWQPTCIQVSAYGISAPDDTGYIKTGRFGFCSFEWKHDTSPFATVDALFNHMKENANG